MGRKSFPNDPRSFVCVMDSLGSLSPNLNRVFFAWQSS
jgi:hypothetical protein